MNSEKKYLILLFILALLLRIVYVYQTFHAEGDANWNDAKLYVYYGKEISKGNLYPVIKETNQRLVVAPVIPLVYALFHIIIPDNYWPFFIYNIILSSLIVILLYYIGKMLWNNILGFAIAIWGLLFIDYMKYTPVVLKEPTICFLLVLLIFLVLKYQQSGRKYGHLIGIALCFTLLIHTDERYFAFFPLLILLPFIFDRVLKFEQRAVLHSLVFSGIVVFLMIPWTIRNYIEYREIVILTPRTTAITSKFWGTNLSAINFDGDIRANKLMKERDENARKYAEQYGIEPRIQKGFESNVRAFINYWQPTYFKPTFIQYGYRFQKWSLRHNLTGLLFYGVFIPFYLLGIIKFIRQGKVFLIWLSFVPIFHSLIHAYMVWPLERYRMPVNFIIVLIALLFILDLPFVKMNLNRISGHKPEL